jgi:uncharacterized protein
MELAAASARSTPCIKLCVIDPLAKLCIGCGRTIDEIARWGGLGEPERRAIMAELEGRLVASRTRQARRRTLLPHAGAGGRQGRMRAAGERDSAASPEPEI